MIINELIWNNKIITPSTNKKVYKVDNSVILGFIPFSTFNLLTTKTLILIGPCKQHKLLAGSFGFMLFALSSYQDLLCSLVLQMDTQCYYHLICVYTFRSVTKEECTTGKNENPKKGFLPCIIHSTCFTGMLMMSYSYNGLCHVW